MDEAEILIETLNLSPHPEGGYFRETYRCNESIAKEHLPERYDGNRSFSTAIYFLLKGVQFSAFHCLKSDEMWHFYCGSSLSMYCISPDGKRTDTILGTGIEKEETPQVIIPAGTWFAATVKNSSSYSLVGCTVAPGFEFSDFEMGDRKQLIKNFPLHEKLITMLTKENSKL